MPGLDTGLRQMELPWNTYITTVKEIKQAAPGQIKSCGYLLRYPDTDTTVP